jgi:rhodanese-related sulfurtransferase|tara:strand:- start:260 stop:733 length:474 start_codon:yes stop_codon:yes gene_type:complete
MAQPYPQLILKIEDALKKMLKGTVPVISTDQLADSINSRTDWIILDSRELAEFEISHLSNAIWVGHLDFSLSRVADISKVTKIAVYCSIGVRSENIAGKLLSYGFSNVWNVYGGIFTWANEHKTLVADNQQPTLDVHGYDKNWAKLLEHHVNCILSK